MFSFIPSSPHHAELAAMFDNADIDEMNGKQVTVETNDLVLADQGRYNITLGNYAARVRGYHLTPIKSLHVPMDPAIVSEGNRIIAMYHGARYNEETDRLFYDTDIMSEFAMLIGSQRILLRDARYHLSWDWMMPAIQKVADQLKTTIFHTVNYILGQMTEKHSEGLEFLWTALVKYLKSNHF